jgi:hypothetical protein
MTPEQVSALSDEELNRAMIWLYPPVKRPYDCFEDSGSMCCSGNYEDCIVYDYLDDYNQTMPLVIEKGVTVIKEEDGRFWAGLEPIAGDGPCIYMDYDVTGETWLRAANECLVLIALADK